MANSFCFNVISNYSVYTHTQISNSLNTIYDFLKGATNVNENDLIISAFAVNHFREQPDSIQSSIKTIRGVILDKEKKEKLSENLLKIFNIFCSAEHFPVLKISNEADISDDACWFVIENHKKNNSPAQFCPSFKISTTTPTSWLSTPTVSKEWREADLDKVIDEFDLFVTSQEVETKYQQNDVVILANQKKLISTFGMAFFEDYLIDVILWLKNKLIESLRDPNLTYRLSLFTEKKGEKCVDETDSPKLVQTSLVIFAQKCVEAVQKIIDDVLTSEKTRKEFPALIYLFIPETLTKDLSKEAKVLLEFLAEFYFPEILLASLMSLQELIQDQQQQQKLGDYFYKFLKNSGSKDKFDFIEIITYVIQNNIPAPAEKGANVLIEKLKDKKLNEILPGLLDNVLNALFFVEPGPLTPKLKKIVTSLIGCLHDFLTVLYAASNNSKNKNSQEIADLILQNFYTKGFVVNQHKTESNDILDLNIRCQVEELLWVLLFPRMSSDHPDATITMKITILILSTYLQNLLTSLFSSDHLYIFIEKLWKDSLSLDDSFEYNLPPDHLFSADDKSFNDEVDRSIKGIVKCILKIGLAKGFKQQIGLKLVHLIPPLGNTIQCKLKKACFSPAAMLPIILGAQLLYEVPYAKDMALKPNQKKEDFFIECQKRFFNALGNERKSSFKAAFTESDAARLKRASTFDKILGTDSKELNDKVATFAFTGSHSIITEIIRNFYQLGKNPIIMKELVLSILHSLKKALK